MGTKLRQRLGQMALVEVHVVEDEGLKVLVGLGEQLAVGTDDACMPVVAVGVSASSFLPSGVFLTTPTW